MNSRRWWLAAGVLAVAVAGGLVWLSRSGDALEQGDKLASVTGALLALAGLVATVVLGLRAGTTTTINSPDEAAEDLAQLVTRQWERASGNRGLTSQEPLEVRWASTERPVAPSAAEVVGAMAGKPLRLKLHGGVGDLAEAVRKLPGHQLVVLGEPGSGKTSAAMLLTLRLLGQRRAGDPVPVLFSLASWDPTSQDLEAWMAHRISVDHPAFRKRGAHGPEAARELVERGMVVPVLDALDEVALRIEAVQGIARAVGRNKPVVLTCRTDDYEQLIGSTGVPLGRAAVVELKPVTSEESAKYLGAGTPDGDHRWQPVVAKLRQEPEGVLARALSTPLAVYLAKTAFTPPRTDPAQLLRLPSSAAVEQHLLEAYLPALYPAAAAADARTWLAFLARRLAMSPAAGNLAWWRVFLLLPRSRLVTHATRGALAGTAFFAAAVLHGTATAGTKDLTGRLLLAVLVLVLTGAGIGASAGRLDHPVPLPRYLAWRGSARRLVISVLVGFVVVMIIGLPQLSKITLGPLVVSAVLAGLAAAVHRLATPISADVPVDPRGSLVSDRRATVVLTLWTLTTVSAAMIALVTAVNGSDMQTVAAAVTAAATLAFWWPFSGAWVNFAVARVWFALFQKLPWRLMDFLEDAHRRGVLRQVGAAYEFRHQRLQQHFSQQAGTAPARCPAE